MATITNKNQPLIHRKEPQMMSSPPVATTTGTFVITDVKETSNLSLFIVSASQQLMYNSDEDGWVQVPSGALTGTFGAGSCGATHRWSNTLTANGGSTTTITLTTNINGLCVGNTVRFLSGLNLGLEATITNVTFDQFSTARIITISAVPNAVANTDTFTIDTGRFFIWNAGTMATGSFKSFDPITSVWTTLSVTGAPTTFANDGKLVSTPSNDAFATGTATSATISTLSNSAKNWTANQWTNYQVRIVSGVGIGQVRTIASNTTTQLTVSTNWTVTPNGTSVYEITGNDDFLYLMGNGAITMFRYQISTNTWTTLAPTVARTGAPQAGMSGNWVSVVDEGNSMWSNENDIKNGRYIYSFRGLATTTLSVYDIALNKWIDNSYNNFAETFTTGSSYTVMNGYIYIRKEATGRMFKFNISENVLEPLTTTFYPESTAVVGDKMWGVRYMEGNVTKLKWLYWLGNTTNVLHRMLLN